MHSTFLSLAIGFMCETNTIGQLNGEEVPIEAKARASQSSTYESNVCYVGEH